MMHFTDITGLAGVAFAIYLFILRYIYFPRVSSRTKVALTGLVLIAVFLPLGGLSIAELLRGISGDLSIASLVLLSAGLCRMLLPSPAGRGIEGDGSCTSGLQIFIFFSALALYPFALGLGMFDPYRLGFGNVWFVAALLLIALVAWLKQFTLVALSVSLAVLAWSVGWYESSNLWDYLLDPWGAIYAMVVLVKNGVVKLRGIVSR
ncbi:MAG: hypothetical protein Q8O24_01800 [Gallionellaceae bacterium]|nr:hypothetical protein [Gallionellaceae bacterium]